MPKEEDTFLEHKISQAVNDSDGTFKSADELKRLYESKSITPDKKIITYYRIGKDLLTRGSC